MTTSLRSYFLLDPDVAYLNHGAFGACPLPVFETYQNWQRELERDPVDFFSRQVRGLFDSNRGGFLDEAREALAKYVNCSPNNLAFMVNSTAALNLVARSIQLDPGAEVLTTSHEYGSIEATWTQVCDKSGAKLVRFPIPLPVTTQEAFIEDFWSRVTPRTQVILMSHITSPSALIFPVAEICRRARPAGIITVIDGAHAIGQIPLNIEDIDPDFYTSNCHKWLCAPKGSAFLYAHSKHQSKLEPLIISWAYVNKQTFSLIHEMWGTRDISAFLSVPAAINFQEEHNWSGVRKECHDLLIDARRKIIELSGQPAIAPEDQGWFAQMAAISLPDSIDAKELSTRLYNKYRIEIPITEETGKKLLRISIQGYNTQKDLDRLLSALETELK